MLILPLAVEHMSIAYKSLQMVEVRKVKLYPLYAMEAQGRRGGIAPTHT
jgi:hypothetical protein